MMFKRCSNCVKSEQHTTVTSDTIQKRGISQPHCGVIVNLLHEKPLARGSNANHLTRCLQIHVLQYSTFAVLFADFAHPPLRGALVGVDNDDPRNTRQENRGVTP
jgi:hypothetical protein